MYLRQVTPSHVDEDDEGKGNEDVSSGENQGEDLAHPASEFLTIKIGFNMNLSQTESIAAEGQKIFVVGVVRIIWL